MRQFFKMFFASLFGVVFAVIILIGLGIGVAMKMSKSTDKKVTINISDNPILALHLSTKFQELSETNSLAALVDEEDNGLSLYDLLETLKAAKTDKNIKALLLYCDGNSNGWATSQQLRLALQDFKKSGKKIYAYGTSIAQKDYYLASVADVVYLNPMGHLEWKGLAAQLNYYKGALDKLGVQPEIFYAGKFKSATEPYRTDKMSDANRIQLNQLLTELWKELLQTTALKSKNEPAILQTLASEGKIQFPSDALKYKLIDGIGYFDELEKMIWKDLDLKPKEQLQETLIENYANTVSDGERNENRIALILAEGEIVDGIGKPHQIGSEDLIKTIRKVKQSKSIKAVVLRVNSPGGSALASDLLLRELDLLKKEKPLVVTMGDYAASGGYYIACHADSIFALPNTLTGSIGVFSMLFNAENLLKSKLGITHDEAKTAPYADFPNPNRPLNEKEAAFMQAMVDSIYLSFKTHVAEGRKMTLAQVDSIAQGRVWTGMDGLSNGLVDHIGGFYEAFASAAHIAKLKDYSISVYPEPTDKFKYLLKSLKGNNVLTPTMVENAFKTTLGADFQYYQQIQFLRNNNGKSNMYLPYQLSIN